MMRSLPTPLAALNLFPQFIGYKLIQRAEGGLDKIPLHCVTGLAHNAHDPAAWGTFEQAAACPGADGVGFVFTEDDPFWFLDIDGAYDPETGKWSDFAADCCARLAGCAVEVSASGRGLHIFGMGAAPTAAATNELGGFYPSKRFVALTGTHVRGNVATDAGAAVTEIVTQYFPRRATTREGTWTDAPRAEWSGYEDDGELIAAACRATSAAGIFGERATFEQLWKADVDALTGAFPPDGPERAYDASRADAALAQHLMFWTGGDCERVKRLMCESGLARDKWQREDYLERTILRAEGACAEVHQRERPVTPAPSGAGGTYEPPRARIINGHRIMPPTEMVGYFAGCVYVTDQHKVFTPDGKMLNSERFRAVYGGWSFAADCQMQKTTKNAWEAFTEGQAVDFPKVDTAQFRPDLPPGEIFHIEGRSVLNTYLPVPVERKKGDVSLLLRHMEKLLPEARDRELLLGYMAACVQMAGKKFQWCPLVQGCPGNGKTLFSRVVSRAVGERLSHPPRASEISNKFNGWLQGKVFAYVEDVYYPESRAELIECLKPLITNDRHAVELKGAEQTLAPVFTNFILNSNHRDAIRKTRDDRRFCVMYTRQQEAADLTRDGMDGVYFKRLYDWLNSGGYAECADFLASVEIPEWVKLSLFDRAPETSSTESAIAESLSDTQLLILEAVESGAQGFCGGYISSTALLNLLREHKRSIPLRKVTEVLSELGYVKHPHLPDGRLTKLVPQEWAKPRIYVKPGSLQSGIRDPATVHATYTTAQYGPTNGIASGGGGTIISV